MFKYRETPLSQWNGYPYKKLQDVNIVSQLAKRQYTIDSPAQFYYRRRAFYQCIVPNYTEANVAVPSGYFRKFTPDGNQLLAFSNDQKGVLVYDFKGAGAAQELYYQASPSGMITLNLFSQFFSMRFNIGVSLEKNLNREFSLFTEDGQYVIVGSCCPLEDDPYPPMHDVLRNNESLSHHIYPLEDYVLYLVDIKAGFVSDNWSFRCDRIALSHNQGLSLCKSTLAVLSLQHQTIHLFDVRRGGFVHLFDIGRFCYPDDQLWFNKAADVVETNGESRVPVRRQPFHEVWFTSLKQRLLTQLIRQAEMDCTPDNRVAEVNFHQKFDYFARLKLWKIQLLSEDHLLLRYASEDIVTHKQTDPTSQPALFAIYCIKTTRMLGVYENTSERLLNIYENYADSFRVPVSHPHSQFTSSVSNNAHARAIHMKFKRTITSAKFGGRSEATRRLLGLLPVCAQSYSCSPYLDMALFSYDDKWVSAVERPKTCGDSPVRSGVWLSSCVCLLSQSIAALYKFWCTLYTRTCVCRI